MAFVGPAAAQTAYVATPSPEPGPGVCPGGLCQAEALTGVFEALAATEAGTRDRPVHILQIGDSHTAGDRITGKVRADLQRRFGRAGRGVMPPGVPWDGYAPYQVTVAQRGWLMETAPLSPPNGPMFQRMGVSGVRAVGLRDAVMGFEPEPGSEATAFGVCGRSSVDGGGVRIEAGGVGLEVGLGDGVTEVCRTLTFPAPVSSVRVMPAGEGAVINSVWLGGAARGVTVSNLGRVGATLRDLAAREEGIVSAELAAWKPDLIVIGFGTNDGFDDGLDAGAYETLLRVQIARMRRLAPGVSLMLLGRRMRSGAGRRTGAALTGRGRRRPSWRWSGTCNAGSPPIWASRSGTGTDEWGETVRPIVWR